MTTPMRIIGGAARGRTLRAPKGEATRPTADRVRESIFNILAGAHTLENARVLDLFAGSGAMGFEAISRGASSAVLVDRDAHAIEAIRKNLTALGQEAAGRTIRIVKDDAARALGRLASTGERFDLVFLDPPYSATDALAAALVRLPPLLATAATVVVEYDRRSPPQFPEALFSSETDIREYGDIRVAFLRAPAELLP